MSVGKRTAVLDRGALRSAVMLALFTLLVGVAFWRVHYDLGPNAILALAIVILPIGAVWAARERAHDLLSKTLVTSSGNLERNLALLLAVSALLLLLVARVVLDAFPNSADEYAYVLQAQTYAQGRLWAPPPADPEAFQQFRFLAKDGIWVSQYEPGWALVLAPFAAVGLPLWIVNPILGTALIGLFFVLARQYLSVQGAWLATLVLMLSAFFLLNFGSYFSHGLGALLAVAAVLFLKKYLDRGLLRDALIAGAIVGFVGLSRVFNAAILIAPMALALLLAPGRRLGLIAFGLGGVPFLAALLAYNAAITGDPLLPVPMWWQPGSEPIGAPTSGYQFETLRRLKRLFVWTSPILFFGWIAAIALLAWRRKLDFVDWIAPATIVFFVFYGGDGGNQYGPRYYFEALPFVVLTTAKLIEPVLFERPGRASNLVAAAVLGHFVYQIGFAVPRLALEHQVIVERQEPYRLAKEAGLSNAVVLVAADSSKTRPMVRLDLVRDGLVIGDEPVTYALDLGAANPRIFAMFPDRHFYRYENGALTPVDCAAEGSCRVQ